MRPERRLPHHRLSALRARRDRQSQTRCRRERRPALRRRGRNGILAMRMLSQSARSFGAEGSAVAALTGATSGSDRSSALRSPASAQERRPVFAHIGQSVALARFSKADITPAGLRPSWAERWIPTIGLFWRGHFCSRTYTFCPQHVVPLSNVNRGCFCARGDISSRTIFLDRERQRGT
jgi:hypothetical protein